MNEFFYMYHITKIFAKHINFSFLLVLPTMKNRFNG